MSIMDKVDRKDLWDYLDAGDVLEIVDVLAPCNPYGLDTDGYEGYDEALDDVRNAAEHDKASGGVRLSVTKEHFEHWNGHVATTASDHGYCNAIEDMLNSIAKLIAQRY